MARLCPWLLVCVVGALSCGREELVVGRLISASSGGSSGESPAGSAGQLNPPSGGADAGVVMGGAGSGGMPDAGVAAAGATSSHQPCGNGTAPCQANEYCSFPAADPCGRNAALGECLRRPTTCPSSCADPMLCACDGERYCNDCFAALAGVDVGPDGVCQYRHCGSWLGIGCSDSEFCDYGDIECGTMAVGNCLVRPMPDACPTACDPVCACDGMQYCNECEANLAGFDRTQSCP